MWTFPWGAAARSHAPRPAQVNRSTTWILREETRRYDEVRTTLDGELKVCKVAGEPKCEYAYSSLVYPTALYIKKEF